MKTVTVEQQAVLGMLKEECTPRVFQYLADKVKNLPPAQPEARNRCLVTCAQYRDGWNDAMNYIFMDGKGYSPYRRR